MIPFNIARGSSSKRYLEPYEIFVAIFRKRGKLQVRYLMKTTPHISNGERWYKALQPEFTPIRDGDNVRFFKLTEAEQQKHGIWWAI